VTPGEPVPEADLDLGGEDGPASPPRPLHLLRIFGWQAALVAGLVELVALPDAAAPEPQHVHVGFRRIAHQADVVGGAGLPPEERARWGKNGRDYYQAHLSFTAALRNYARVFDSLARPGRRRTGADGKGKK